MNIPYYLRKAEARVGRGYFNPKTNECLKNKKLTQEQADAHNAAVGLKAAPAPKIVYPPINEAELAAYDKQHADPVTVTETVQVDDGLMPIEGEVDTPLEEVTVALRRAMSSFKK